MSKAIFFSSVLFFFFGFVVFANAQTTWNSADKSANITLSNGDLTATTSSASSGGVRATTNKTTGKWYYEIVSVTSKDIWSSPGLSDNAWDFSGASGTGLWVYLGGQGGYSECENTQGGGSYGNFSVDVVVGVAYDADGGTMAIYRNNSLIFTCTGVDVGLYPTWQSASLGDSVTVNFGATPFEYDPPTGFVAWDTEEPAQTITTYEASQQVYMGFIVYFISFFGVVWLMRRK